MQIRSWALTVDFGAGCSSCSMTNSFVTNAVLIERAVSCWHLHQLISQTAQYLHSWLSDLLQSELKMKLWEVEKGARGAPVSHSWHATWNAKRKWQMGSWHITNKYYQHIRQKRMYLSSNDCVCQLLRQTCDHCSYPEVKALATTSGPPRNKSWWRHCLLHCCYYTTLGGSVV